MGYCAIAVMVCWGHGPELKTPLCWPLCPFLSPHLVDRSQIFALWTNGAQVLCCATLSQLCSLSLCQCYCSLLSELCALFIPPGCVQLKAQTSVLVDSKQTSNGRHSPPCKCWHSWKRVPGGSWNEPSQFPEAGCLGLHNWKPRFPLFFPTILKFFYIGSTFSLDLCGGRVKKSVFQMCPLACNFFKNSLSGVTVCGLLLFFWLRASNFQVTFSVLFVKI